MKTLCVKDCDEVSPVLAVRQGDVGAVNLSMVAVIQTQLD